MQYFTSFFYHKRHTKYKMLTGGHCEFSMNGQNQPLNAIKKKNRKMPGYHHPSFKPSFNACWYFFTLKQ